MPSLAVLAAKALVLIGPWAAKFARWRAFLPSMGVSAPAIGLGLALAVLGFAAWEVHGWLQARTAGRAKATEIATEAQQICTAANQAARIAALEKALTEREAAEKSEAAGKLVATATLSLLIASQEAARHASPNPDQILIPAGDPWLLRGPFGVPGAAPGRMLDLRAGAGHGRLEGPRGR